MIGTVLVVGTILTAGAIDLIGAGALGGDAAIGIGGGAGIALEEGEAGIPEDAIAAADGGVPELTNGQTVPFSQVGRLAKDWVGEGGQWEEANNGVRLFRIDEERKLLLQARVDVGWIEDVGDVPRLVLEEYDLTADPVERITAIHMPIDFER